MPVPPAKLKIYQAGHASQEFLLDRYLVSIGSESDNTLILAEPGVARYHAQIVRKADYYAIATLGHAAATLVNQTPLSPRLPQTLNQGDVIRIGNFELHFYQDASVAEFPALPGTIVTGGSNYHILQVTTPQWTQEFPLQQETLILGRDPRCDIVIDLPVVSLHHAELRRSNGSYAISDLGSKNGLIFAG